MTLQSKKATHVLKEDHRIIEKVLDRLEKLALAPEKSSFETWDAALDFIQNFADRCHHLKEEKVYFPALEALGIPREYGPIGMMLAEHEEGRAHVREMAAALARAKTDPRAAGSALSENAIAYIHLLRQHIAKENDILFPMADGVLTAEEDERLVREFEEREAKETGPGVHERYLRLAEELESDARGEIRHGPIYEFFAADHARLDGLLGRALGAEGTIEQGAYAEFRKGLLRHIAMEEKVLLPAAQTKRGGEALPQARKLRLDHGALAALLVPSPSPKIIAAIGAILRAHNAVEEGPGGVYEACEELLGTEAEDLLIRLRGVREVSLAPHVDGPQVFTAARRALSRAGYDSQSL